MALLSSSSGLPGAAGEMADTKDLESFAARLAGSTPAPRTITYHRAPSHTIAHHSDSQGKGGKIFHPPPQLLQFSSALIFRELLLLPLLRRGISGLFPSPR